jgi:hypothetical protein
LQKFKDDAIKAKDEAISAFRAMTSKLLQDAWANLIPSFGLTLIWIDIHFFLNMVFGDKFFCDLGGEWMPAGVPELTKK